MYYHYGKLKFWGLSRSEQRLSPFQRSTILSEEVLYLMEKNNSAHGNKPRVARSEHCNSSPLPKKKFPPFIIINLNT